MLLTKVCNIFPWNHTSEFIFNKVLSYLLLRLENEMMILHTLFIMCHIRQMCRKHDWKVIHTNFLESNGSADDLEFAGTLVPADANFTYTTMAVYVLIQCCPIIILPIFSKILTIETYEHEILSVWFKSCPALCLGVCNVMLQLYHSIIVIYNMVVMAVTMVISTMHGNSFTWCMQIWKKFQNSVIDTSPHRYDEIAETSYLCIS